MRISKPLVIEGAFIQDEGEPPALVVELNFSSGQGAPDERLKAGEERIRIEGNAVLRIERRDGRIRLYFHKLDPRSQSQIAEEVFAFATRRVRQRLQHRGAGA